MYHYYLHGEGGNREALSRACEGRLPNGEPFPDITLRNLVDTRVVWSKKLAEVRSRNAAGTLCRTLRPCIPNVLQQRQLPYLLSIDARCSRH